MVSFQCEGCGDVLTPEKLDAHSNTCRAPVTCIDCMTTFDDTTYRTHASCMTESQSYESRLYDSTSCSSCRVWHIRCDGRQPCTACRTRELSGACSYESPQSQSKDHDAETGVTKSSNHNGSPNNRSMEKSSPEPLLFLPAEVGAPRRKVQISRSSFKDLPKEDRPYPASWYGDYKGPKKIVLLNAGQSISNASSHTQPTMLSGVVQPTGDAPWLSGAADAEQGHSDTNMFQFTGMSTASPQPLTGGRSSFPESAIKEKTPTKEQVAVKVNAEGYLSDGWRSKIPTFQLSSRPKTWFMLASDCSEVLGAKVLASRMYALRYIVALHKEKEELFDRGILKSVSESEVLLLTALSVFRCFETNVIERETQSSGRQTKFGLSKAQFDYYSQKNTRRSTMLSDPILEQRAFNAINEEPRNLMTLQIEQNKEFATTPAYHINSGPTSSKTQRAVSGIKKLKDSDIFGGSLSPGDKVLACPFNKYDANLFGVDSPDPSYRVCSTFCTKGVHHLKQHMILVHRAPEQYCYFCYRDDFPNEQSLQDHLRERLCKPSGLPKFREKIGPDLAKRLRLVGKNPRGTSSTDYWYKLFDGLFPGVRDLRDVTPEYEQRPLQRYLDSFAQFSRDNTHVVLREAEKHRLGGFIREYNDAELEQARQILDAAVKSYSNYLSIRQMPHVGRPIQDTLDATRYDPLDETNQEPVRTNELPTNPQASEYHKLSSRPLDTPAMTSFWDGAKPIDLASDVLPARNVDRSIPERTPHSGQSPDPQLQEGSPSHPRFSTPFTETLDKIAREHENRKIDDPYILIDTAEDSPGERVHLPTQKSVFDYLVETSEQSNDHVPPTEKLKRTHDDDLPPPVPAEALVQDDLLEFDDALYDLDTLFGDNSLNPQVDQFEDDFDLTDGIS